MASEQLATAIVDTAAYRAKEPRTQRVLLILTGVVMLAAILLFGLYLNAFTRVTALQQQTGELRGQVAQVQAGQVDAASKSQALADQVRALGQTPVVTPAVPGAGPAGAPGRGIAGTTIRDGRLVLFFSDGTTSDVGQVAGAGGADGAAGVSISATLLVNDHLMITYSDGRTVDVGQVVGQAGPPGTPGVDGKPGRSVTSLANTNGHLIVTYDDGTTQDVGALPVAPAGRPPSGWSYTDSFNQQHDCTPDTPPDPGTSPHYTCT